MQCHITTYKKLPVPAPGYWGYLSNLCLVNLCQVNLSGRAQLKLALQLLGILFEWWIGYALCDGPPAGNAGYLIKDPGPRGEGESAVNGILPNPYRVDILAMGFYVARFTN